MSWKLKGATFLKDIIHEKITSEIGNISISVEIGI